MEKWEDFEKREAKYRTSVITDWIKRFKNRQTPCELQGPFPHYPDCYVLRFKVDEASQEDSLLTDELKKLTMVLSTGLFKAGRLMPQVIGKGYDPETQNYYVQATFLDTPIAKVREIQQLYSQEKNQGYSR